MHFCSSLQKEKTTYSCMVRNAATNVKIFEKLGRPAILPRDLLPDFSRHSSEMTGIILLL